MTATVARPDVGIALPGDEWFDRLVDLTPDGILVHSAGEVVMANRAAAELAGATRPEELLARHVDSLLDPPYLKAIQGQLHSASDVISVAQPIRDTLHRLDGVDLPVEVRAVAFMGHGQPSVLLVIRDISDRLAAQQTARLMEQRLQQAQRMETVGALAGGVAHEVNNMLQIVLGFGAVLIDDPRLPAACLPDLRQIVQAANRAATVTAQLLAYGRRAVHRPEAVDLLAAVRDAEPMLRRSLGHGQLLSVRGSSSLHAWVDPSQLAQVLVNLTLNATAAMSPGGVLSITTAPTDLAQPMDSVAGTIPAGRYAVIQVRDTGDGMDSVTLSRIFEPFFTTKELGEGTGLGLAATLGIMTQNHGYITVASAMGQGTMFSLYLPTHLPLNPAGG
ncbi:MAG: ATP-binding protein, partial [Gemmatimonadales bacterium]